MSTNKKMKTTNSNEEFENVKKYLLACPHVSPDHPLIKAALTAIDKEQQRVERDRKLQMKFSQGTVKTVDHTAFDDSVVVVERRSSSPATRTEESVDEMEWQDVEEKEKESSDDQTSYLGKNLAKMAIDMIADHKTRLKSPLAAIAVAFHASLRSDLLGFSCTGIPEDESASKGGFAPPVRELPKTQFLPASWDNNLDKISLRYRKAGTGAMVLKVEQGQGQEQTCTVRWQPASSKEPCSQTLTFSLEDHVNLVSWNAALKTAPSVSPALHYKSLALLITNFCRTFDLGSIDEDMEERATASIPYVDNTIPRSIEKSDFVPARPVEIQPAGASNKPNYRDEFPTTLGEAFPGINLHRPSGDFAGDLAPAGLRDPRFPSTGGRLGGNLMGPNHPMFRGGGDLGIPIGGPGSMQPRFDPIYPEGIDFPNGGHPGRKLNRPSRSGEPNPDHLPPPNSFSDNMFS